MDLLILVTLGTQKQHFTRLLDYIEKSDVKDKIVVQAGETIYRSEKMQIFDFISYEELDKLVDEAEIIITHGGTGSVIGPLKKGKKVIGCARKKEFKEHSDNHQEQLISLFAEEGYILELKENTNLCDIIKKAENFKPRKFVSNTDNFIKKLKKIIDN